MKRILVPVMILGLGFLLLPTLGMAQSTDTGMRLWDEAWNSHQKARSKKDLVAAILKYQEALRIFNKERHTQGIARVTNNMGLVYQDLANYDKATECYRAALSLARTIGDRNCEDWALNNLGEVHRLKAEYDKAIDSYGQSMAVTKSIGNRKMVGRTMNNMGLVNKDWGRYDKAIELYKQSMAISKSIGDEQMVGRVLNNMGEAHRLTAQYDKAIGLYERSIAISSSSEAAIRLVSQGP